MAISWIQPSFAGGEIGPSLYGRIDMAKYQVALRKCDNFIVRQYGGVENRPGTRFVGAAKYPNRKCRLIPFQFSTVQTYALEFGHQYMRVIKDGALVLNSSNVIYEIATPYTEADLFRIKFTQSADVLTLVHPAYPPKELRRYAHDNWQLVDVVTKNGPFEDINIDESVTVYASASTGTITLTASASIFGAEQVGKLFYLEQPAVDSVPVWETVRVRRLAIFAVQTVTTIAPLQQAKQVLCALRIQKAHHGMAGADPVMMILALSGSICTVVLALPVSLLQMALLQLLR